MDEETLALLTDLHIHNHRQGPGSDAAFLEMLALSGIDTHASLTIADIGCGTGSATLPLLQHTRATVTAVDIVPAFLRALEQRAKQEGVSDRVRTCEADMSALPFVAEQFDALWSEGAVYTIGFRAGVAAWREFLKPGGVLVVSEITLLTPDAPEPLRNYWKQEYPEIGTAAKNIGVLEQSGYVPIGYFPLPPACWLDNYYTPLQEGFADFLARHNHAAAAEAIVAAEQREIELYKTYRDHISYGAYIARKPR